jgi:hypothetical protein
MKKKPILTQEAAPANPYKVIVHVEGMKEEIMATGQTLLSVLPSYETMKVAAAKDTRRDGRSRTVSIRHYLMESVAFPSS